MDTKQNHTLPSGETVGHELTAENLERIENCDHEWVVFSTALQDVCLLVECVKCCALGTVGDPSEEEWCDAFYAPEKPYGWPDKSRVTVRGITRNRHVGRDGKKN